MDPGNMNPAFEAFKALFILSTTVTLLVVIIILTVLAIDNIKRKIKKKRKMREECFRCLDANTIKCPLYRTSRLRKFIDWAINLWDKLSEWPKYPY